MKKMFINLLVNMFARTVNHQIRGSLLKMIAKLDDSSLKTTRKIMKDNYGITIGKKSYGCFKTDASIEPGSVIGAFCSFAPGVTLGGMNHPLQFVSTHPFLYDKSNGFVAETNQEVINNGTPPVIIEDDVWLGRNAIVLPGVRVGKGSVIASGAVVTKDVSSYSIVGGVPAKLIKKRFSDEQIERLIGINWADWSDEKIKNELHTFYNIDDFVKKHS